MSNGSNGASLSMALATAVAMFCYLAAIFSLREPERPREGQEPSGPGTGSP
ncbi:MAG TPA: hypothetical protein VGS62_01450 [Streptosporangiaceae bacterium]|nr:hypothetical protein [Streptosporangiaceae bacterium]